MKKSNLTGWKDVFSFTLIQTLKSKAFIVSFVIMLVMAGASMPLINMITSAIKTDPDAPNPVSKIYVNNQTELTGLDFTGIRKDKTLSHVAIEDIQEDYETVTVRIEEYEQNAIILTISDRNEMYSLDFIKASNGPVKDINLETLQIAVLEQFDIMKLKMQGISQEQLAMLNAQVNTVVTKVDENGAPVTKEDTSISDGEYWFIYGILFIVLMVNVMASSQIATSIVTEKSTRVVEYLLTSIKPLALMVGKILAMLTAVLLQMGTMVILLFISNIISANISGSGESVLTTYLPENIFANLNIVNIVSCFILILLGMLFYATLAGIAGASVSKLEEISEGLTLFSLINLVGAYIGMGAAGILMEGGMNTFVTFAFLFPLSSPFVLPGAILIGKVGLPMIAGAIVLQIIFIALLFRFVAKVYETLILHTGNTIKLKELIRISKAV